MSDVKDNANTRVDALDVETVIEAQPIILGAEEPVFVMGGDTVIASASDEPIVVSPDPVATDDTVVIPVAPAEEPIIVAAPAEDSVIIPAAPAEDPVIIPAAPAADPIIVTAPAEEPVIIPVAPVQQQDAQAEAAPTETSAEAAAATENANATETESLDAQLAAMLAEPSNDNEIEEIEQQVNAILRQDVISPLDEQLLISLQERLETLLNGPSPTAAQPIVAAETPTTEEATAETETPAPEIQTATETPETTDATSETPGSSDSAEPSTPAQAAADAEPESPKPMQVAPSNIVDAAARAVEAEKAKAALLAYLAARPIASEPQASADAEHAETVSPATSDPFREIDALKRQIKELEIALRRQIRDDDRPHREADPESDRRRDRDDDRRSREDDRRDRDDERRRIENAMRRAARRNNDPYADRYYEQPPVAPQQHDKPSSILDNMFQQWFESEVTEKFRSLFDDKKEGDRRGDEPKEIRPEVVTVSDPDTLPGLVSLGKNLYFNPNDGKAYYIAPVSSLPPGMSSPTKSVAKRPARKRPAPRAARPRARRRPMRPGRRRSPFGRPLRRPPPRRY